MREKTPTIGNRGYTNKEGATQASIKSAQAVSPALQGGFPRPGDW